MNPLQHALVMATALIAGGIAFGQAQNVEERFRVGVEAVREGHLDLAVRTFHRLLIDRPDLLRVRLELAKAFYLQGKDDLARRHFEAALAGDLPSAVEANIRRFLDAIRARQHWQMRFGVGIAPSNNLGATSTSRTLTIGGLPFKLQDPGRKSGVGLSIWTGGEYQHLLGPRWRLRAGADLARKEYKGGAFDRMTLSGYTGPRWLIDDRTEASLLLNVSRAWLGGKGEHHDVGPTLEVHRRLSRRVTVSGALSRLERHHDRATAQDGPRTSLRGGLSYTVSPTIKLHLSAGLSGERPKDQRQRNDGREVSIGADWILGQGYVLGGSLGMSQTDYERPQFPYTAIDEPREDETLTYRLSLHNKGWTIGGFSPRLSLTHETRDSNAQLHDYERTSGEFQLVRQF